MGKNFEKFREMNLQQLMLFGEWLLCLLFFAWSIWGLVMAGYITLNVGNQARLFTINWMIACIYLILLSWKGLEDASKKSTKLNKKQKALQQKFN